MHEDSSRDTPRRMPGARSIRDFWAPWLVEEGRADSVADVLSHDWCFACGMEPLTRKDGQLAEGKCERAHIIARCDGGDDQVDNLHMLCRHCHKASEGLTGEDYWQWFKSRTLLDTLIQATSAMGANLGALLIGKPERIWP